MPELPEVETTVSGLNLVLKGLSIKDMWSDSKLAKNSIKDKNYFPYFSKNTLRYKVLRVRRRAKYILIDLENEHTLVIHMKMTGHLMYGTYKKNKDFDGKEWAWLPDDDNRALSDPYNRHIHVVFTLSDDKHLVFCDSRKFGTMTVEKTTTIHTEKLLHLGPEPLEKSFNITLFKQRLLKSPKRSIKTVLMDQSILAGVGNIYSDEMLHASHILPSRTPISLTEEEITLLFNSMQSVLRKGIHFGGDSMSDYRNIEGKRGEFQAEHLVYLRTKLPCKRKNCRGSIEKRTINGRSAHFCPLCQK